MVDSADRAFDDEVIVKVLGEGGGVTLLRERTAAGRTRFRVAKNDASYALLDEDEGGGAVLEATELASDWVSALALLDRLCRNWPKLVPRQIHPEFAELFLEEVRKRAGRVEKWAEALGTKTRES